MALLGITLGGGGVCTLGACIGCIVDFLGLVGVVFFLCWVSCEKMLLSCCIAWYCASPGVAKGEVGWWPLSADASDSAARVALSRGEANGTAQLCGKKSTVLATRSALVLGT